MDYLEEISKIWKDRGLRNAYFMEVVNGDLKMTVDEYLGREEAAISANLKALQIVRAAANR